MNTSEPPSIESEPPPPAHNIRDWPLRVAGDARRFGTLCSLATLVDVDDSTGLMTLRPLAGFGTEEGKYELYFLPQNCPALIEKLSRHLAITLSRKTIPPGSRSGVLTVTRSPIGYDVYST